MTQPLHILFAGSGEFGRPSLEALRQRHEVVRVYTQPDRPAGRGRRLTPTPIAAFAEAEGLPLTKTADLNAESLPPADVLVVIAFGQRISEPVTRHARLGAVNLHASLLPKYRGAAPIHHAQMNGETVVGNSIIRLARKMDAGAILAQSRLQVRPAETTGELHDRLAEDGAGLVLKVLDDLATGSAQEREQDHASATLAPKLSRTDALIDWTRPAAHIAARINALSPWPGCQVRLMEGDVERDALTLLRARPSPASREPAARGRIDGQGLPWGAHPGQITFTGAVACGDGSTLEVLELQPRGRKPMSLEAYRNGKPWRQRMHLESLQ